MLWVATCSKQKIGLGKGITKTSHLSAPGQKYSTTVLCSHFCRFMAWRMPLHIAARAAVPSAYNPNCSMAGFPVYKLAEMIPMAENMAIRPLLSSRARISSE